jgi:hypothetical protein
MIHSSIVNQVEISYMWCAGSGAVNEDTKYEISDDLAAAEQY